MPDLKELVRRIPLAGPLLVQLRRRFVPAPVFEKSGQYWEDRYAAGGNSGAGSYSRLAHFKAEVLNAFVVEHGVGEVAELGCGDGAQLALARYPRYTGYDISPTSVALCRKHFAGDDTKRFEVITPDTTPDPADLMLSLDVVYHLVEDEVFDRYMHQLFASARRFVIVYSSNYDQYETAHVRHRQFGAWIDQHRPGFRLIRHIPNRYPFDALSPSKTSIADFYIYSRADIA